MSRRTYLELSQLKTFEERFEYLRVNSSVGIETFGSDRFLNQILYHDPEWRSVRNRVIIRDSGCDLGILDREISGEPICIHHLNPITRENVLNRDPCLFDMNNLICCTLRTHNAIHYGDSTKLIHDLVERKPNDTCPWRS